MCVSICVVAHAIYKLDLTVESEAATVALLSTIYIGLVAYIVHCTLQSICMFGLTIRACVEKINTGFYTLVIRVACALHVVGPT
jgi:hypothetical protein